MDGIELQRWYPMEVGGMSVKLMQFKVKDQVQASSATCTKLSYNEDQDCLGNVV